MWHHSILTWSSAPDEESYSFCSRWLTSRTPSFLSTMILFLSWSSWGENLFTTTARPVCGSWQQLFQLRMAQGAVEPGDVQLQVSTPALPEELLQAGLSSSCWFSEAWAGSLHSEQTRRRHALRSEDLLQVSEGLALSLGEVTHLGAPAGRCGVRVRPRPGSLLPVHSPPRLRPIAQACPPGRASSCPQTSPVSHKLWLEAWGCDSTHRTNGSLLCSGLHLEPKTCCCRWGPTGRPKSS